MEKDKADFVLEDGTLVDAKAGLTSTNIDGFFESEPVDWRTVMANIRNGTTTSCSCPGTDETPWNPECAFHKVGHYHKKGCCEASEDDHRHMTGTEYDAEYPILFDEVMQTGDTWLHVETRHYTDGTGTTITRRREKDDDFGLCFDIGDEEVDPLIAMLMEVRRATRP